MKRLLISSIILLLSIPTFAQLEVKEGSFKEVPGFVNINPDPIYQTDDNDLPFAIIKVRTENITDKQRRKLYFEGNAGTFIMLEYKIGEIWVYLTAKYADYLKISHPDLSSVEFTLPMDLEPKKGYEVTIVNKSVPIQSGWGKLFLTTIPENDAIITLNGKVLDQKTPYVNEMIPAGQYEISVSKERFQTETRTITITEGENSNIEIELSYIYGDISVDSKPSGATIIIDGFNYGTTPLYNQQIIVGNHELKIQKPGFATITKTIIIDEANTLTLNETLENGQEISISTDKPGDLIYIDGNYMGFSPFNTSLILGDHIIKAVRDNFEISKRITLTIKEGEFPVDLMFAPEGAINSVFSVSSDNKVVFSKGNLQYNASKKTWGFADQQWDVIGNANKSISKKYSGWIDLFGWGTSGYNGKYPYMISTANTDYGNGDYSITDTKYDWGVYNTISNSGGGKWRTLNSDEWEYVFDIRVTNSGKRYAKANVNGINGIILLPDNWDEMNYNLVNANTADADFNTNIINKNEWINKLEANGAVFLPAAGFRGERVIECVGTNGYYWSATYNDKYSAYNVTFYNSNLNFHSWDYRGYGFSVRLVCDM